MYQLLIIDNDLHGSLEEREHYFPPVSEEWVAGVAGVTWITKYPNDIAMVIETGKA